LRYKSFTQKEYAGDHRLLIPLHQTHLQELKIIREKYKKNFENEIKLNGITLYF